MFLYYGTLANRIARQPTVSATGVEPEDAKYPITVDGPP